MNKLNLFLAAKHFQTVPLSGSDVMISLGMSDSRLEKRRIRDLRFSVRRNRTFVVYVDST